MVYSKSDGSGTGFSWEKQLRFLQTEHADNLEENVLTKLEVLLRRSHPSPSLSPAAKVTRSLTSGYKPEA